MYRVVETAAAEIVFAGDQGEVLRLSFPAPQIVRVTHTLGRAIQDSPSRIVVERAPRAHCTCVAREGWFDVVSAGLRLRVDEQTGALSYYNAMGVLLTREPARGGRWLTPKSVYRNVYPAAATAETSINTDGVRAAAAPAATVLDRMAFAARLEFEFQPEEALFGLGSHEEGYANLRGRVRELYQQNMKAVVPMLVSTRGYAVLLDCCSLMLFRDDMEGSSWWADVVEELDYYVMAGATHDALMESYRLLTGPAPMLPLWAFGYIQSKERYVTGAEMVEVVREYRARRVPLDAVVLDWKSWPNGPGWGQKSLDSMRFASGTAVADALHALHAHWMISLWPIMTGACEDQQEMQRGGHMLGNQATYNAFSAEARALYWKQAERGLWSRGVDAWWCDCTEPFEADWAGAEKPEPEVRLRINTEAAKQYLDAGDLNAFSLLHSQGIYEGQRSVTSHRRVLNLTRSAYAGQHRYGTVTWNGDICATWEWLRISIAEGVHFCATGEPYWSVDIGGFFVQHDPTLWFWRGSFNAGCRGLTPPDLLAPDCADTGCTDLGFHELYTRWLQYAVFLPMFRSHGTDAPREVWRFGEPGGRFYDTLVRFIHLRYELLPYLYSLASRVSRHGAAMLRSLALEFPADVVTHDIGTQFLCGPALLVCPVVEPMYYGPGSTPLSHAKTMAVYLPSGADWYCFWSNRSFKPGWHTVAAPLETMPVFVRAGSVVPMAEPVQHTGQLATAHCTLRVYAGADCSFAWYEDEGDGYAYEQGAFTLTPIAWSEATRRLTLGERQGSFAGMAAARTVTVQCIMPHAVRQVSLTLT
ncbi:MAG: DUF5110 domain-containing protein, partial [Acidobacteriota bacterium]|nr:DUF5110 domain-containing protein [Acidobacteriota bacterium]